MKDISGKYFVVTGGASGLGQAAAIKIAQEGGNVLILDLDEKKGKKFEQELNSKHSRTAALFYKCNIVSEDDVKKALAMGTEKLGTLAGLINCAGIASAKTVVGKDAAHPLALFQKVMEVNVIGNFNVLRLVAQTLSEQQEGNVKDGERGVIIQTASVAAFDGQLGQAAYSASKGAIVGMTLPIARELGRFGIRVLTVAPGVFETPMAGYINEKVRQRLLSQTPFPHRLGDPAEFADLCFHIIQNTFLNGETIRIDGSIRMPL